MRSVTLVGYDFRVRGDPRGVVGYFLGFAASNPDYSQEQLLDRLKPGGPGYSVQDVTGVAQIETLDDLEDVLGWPEETPEYDLDDLWVVWKERDGDALIYGSELRALLSAAAALWKARPSR